MSFLLSKENAGTIEQSEIDTLEDRLQGIKALDGNPMGVEIRKFGKAAAFSVKNIPGPSFNTIKGMTEGEIDRIDAILDFYLTKNIPARFEINPAKATKELLRNLTGMGYYQCGFHTAIYGTLDDDLDRPKENADAMILIEEIKQEQFDIFGEVYTSGFNMPSFLKNSVTDNNKILLDDGNWRFYLARVGGEPAGVGVLFVKNGIGTLAASATVPEFRNKGVHKALIHERIEKSKELKCHLVVGQAAYGSVSQKNMERAGLKIAYTNAIWEKF